MNVRMRRIPALLGAALVTAGLTAGGGAPATAAASPGTPRVVNPGPISSLSGTFCTAKDNCWAVGTFETEEGAGLNQVLHWNGTKWSKAGVPSPGGTAAGHFSELHAVRCRGASNCWSVGDYTNKAGATVNQALHWNGTKWSLMRTPSPGGALSDDFNTLSDVVCAAATACWAAGSAESNAGSTDDVVLNVLLRWNGHTWSMFTATPQPAGSTAGNDQELASIRCTSALKCLAVGTAQTAGSPSVILNEALQWDGTKWSALSVPSPGGTSDGDFSKLTSLACVSATNCRAAGAYGNFGTGTSLNQILQWDGTTWTQDTTVPNPDGTGAGDSNELLGATCTSASDCWAVGDYGHIVSDTGRIVNQALHWDGHAWTQFSAPAPGDFAVNRLRSVRCNTPARCWAVGDANPLNEALLWNGTKWVTR